ncbi:GntR family transcriptional regulator [[Eubacterium] hominis]|uniref:GntR family transcriptional regulator n=1 Tax=[Eubacterium] hominis TaxID=2764325 RepID=UPI003A4DC86D
MMISFHSLVLHKKEPVYLQICRYIKQRILMQEIKDYEELPSRRELAMQLSINPNTVQKAYKLLEEEHIIRTISNVKSVIVVNEEIIESIRSEFVESDIKEFIQNCKNSGMTFQKVIELLTKYWDE